jgi:dihydrodipicolinate synthase/N-acetylneuraminate lyase
MLTGVLAAAATPLRDGGAALDADAFGPMTEFLAAGGVDGVLALGTTGEGILLTADERKRAARLFMDHRPEGFAVAVHCGAQTTAETVALAAHAAGIGADAVAVIGPPYYAFDERELHAHFLAAASACEPLPFYVYEFEARAGYVVPPAVIERLREDAANLSGLKVSDSPMDRVLPYLLEGLDVFVGQEPLAIEAMAAGAAGCVSGLAAAFPEVVADLVHRGSRAAHDHVVSLREQLRGMPFQAALKAILAERGVPVHEDVRAPLRTLTEHEHMTAMSALRAVTAA